MRIAGSSIPDEKRVEIALTYIFGVGQSHARKILRETKIDFNKRAKHLTSVDANAIKDFIEKHFKIEGDLRRDITANIKRLKDIKAYRGVRHMRRLPTRGQSTKRNSRTVRGNARKSVGSGRKPTSRKT
jgi:small subunit ribosomal protein S13